MQKNYLTIKTKGSNEVDIKKSRFICNIARVQNEEEANNFIESIKLENKKATHNCYAYVIGQDDHIQRASDNGEPSGTAGVPILDAIKMIGIHNTVAVVTRYFGGIKLGAGGLIRAYSNATTKAIESVGVIEKVLQTEITINVDYKLFNQLQYHLNENDINIIDTQYTDKVSVIVAIDNHYIENFKQDIVNLLNNRVNMVDGDEKYFELDFNPYKNNKKD
ncbi:YigZ family protein [Apilactobacillus timberlakei]|uniref:YigZ family protein n=1 Tax=Apilactobacillus timberlakei TaxID=2008380 RepID=UPI00112BD7CF|nr:YigZ family protein [Apilactobacillus timberlakei]TPR17718.1 YigZ family protein [Apilactobacillus timberlakei]TPR17935.1 YigZ family protein [Apilactobacillus timberlakei]TPR19741.1 YigZ family protein [Apilactobacillus timberlakei]TPR21247.1 YigZ family protein [Apilactobacillus timberlakei]TPR22454.1 YigZ family protein [Apilactobacillus timberlakei]